MDEVEEMEKDKEEEEEEEENKEEENKEEDDSSKDYKDAFSNYIKVKHIRIEELRGWLDAVGDRYLICVAM